MSQPKTVSLACLLGLLACLSFGSPPARAEADAWPQFRGSGGQGLSAATNIPVHWSATSNVMWNVPVPGRGWSSPVVAAGRIYLTTAVPAGESLSLRALCFDAATGKSLWDSEVLRPEPSLLKSIHSKNSQASGTPIIAADRLYVHFGHLGTAALDPSGKVIWRLTSLRYAPMHGNGGSPELIGDKLVFSCDGEQEPFVVALDIRTGAVRWKTPRTTLARNKFSFGTPLPIEVAGTRQLVSTGSGFVGGYRLDDGAELWRVTYGEGFSVVPRPVFSHGLLFICTGFNTASLLAIKPEGTRGDATAKHIAWTHRKGVPTTSSPICVGDELYFVSDGGVATCLDARSGNVIWNERLGGDFSASPVAAEGRLYFLSEAGVGFVLKSGRQFTLLAQNALGERTFASPAVLDSALILRSESRLWRIGN